MSSRGDELLLGRILIRLGYIVQEQISNVIEAQSSSGTPLGDSLIQKRLISREQLEEALAFQRDALSREPIVNAAGETTLFGQRVQRLKLASEQQVNAALRVQGQAWEGERVIRHLGMILVEQGVLDQSQVLLVLQSQGKVLGECKVCNSRFNIPAPELKQPSVFCVACGGLVETLDILGVSGLDIVGDLSDPEKDENDRNAGAYGGGPVSSLGKLVDSGDNSVLGSGVSLASDLFEGISQKPSPHESTLEQLLSSTKTDERYVVDREINRGGMGAILSAVDRDIRRQVAMKVMLSKGRLSSEHVKRFVEEAQVTGQLEHPNIVPIHELGVDNDGQVYFTMKMVRGQSLGDILDRKQTTKGRALDPSWLSEMLNIFIKVCDGIAFAHSRGVIHRDLKPDNIMVGQFGEVLVMDWGLARISGSEGSHGVENIKSVRSDQAGDETQDGQVMGTPSYMPPEQAAGNIEDIDQRSDIYSLGAVLYEMLTGQAPFEGRSAQDILERVREGDVALPEKLVPELDLPTELSAVCMKALAYDRDDRYSDVLGLTKDIRSFLDGRMVAAYQYNPIQVLGKWLWRHRMAVSGIMLIGLICLGAWSYVRYQEHQLEAQEQQRALEERNRTIALAKGLKAEGDSAHGLANQMDVAVESLDALQESYQVAVHLYQRALFHLPDDLKEDMDAVDVEIGEIYFKLFRIAEEKENPALTASYGKLTQQFLGDKYSDVIEGLGQLNLTSNVPAHIEIFPALEPRSVKSERERPLGIRVGFDPEAGMDLGRTPIDSAQIPMGSWLLIAKATETTSRSEIRLPLWVGRNEKITVENLRLIKNDEIPKGMVYIPSGMRRVGAPKSMQGILKSERFRMRAHKGFFIAKYEVTNEDWWDFLQHKIKENPRSWAGYRPRAEEPGREIFIWTPHMVSGVDKSANWESMRCQPVVGISWEAAAEYAKWRGAHLPTTDEWETAARGADARLYAWGNFYDVKKANVYGFMHSTILRPVGAMPFDCSPFGVFDMTGNASEWTSDWLDEALQLRAVCGANFQSGGSDVILFVRKGAVESSRRSWLGFRIAKDLPAEKAAALRKK